jgi:hypothetical protein
MRLRCYRGKSRRHSLTRGRGYSRDNDGARGQQPVSTLDVQGSADGGSGMGKRSEKEQVNLASMIAYVR